MPRGRYQQQQWEMRQDAILDALAELAEAQGFASVTMDDLADAVGISKATLYQHFSSKDDLLVALIHQHTARFIDWLESTADQPPTTRLRETVRYLLEGHVTPLHGLLKVSREDARPVFENHAELIAQHTATLDTLSAIIRQGQADGSITTDLAPQVIIRSMWALGMMSLDPLQSLPEHAALTHERYITQILTLFERSLQPAPRA